MLEQLGLIKPGLGRYAWVARLLADYLALTKPPIIMLLLITALGGMFLAAGGVPQLSVVLLVCAGGALAAGGANALNHYQDYRIDGMMSRTWQRPLPSGRISRRQALVAGVLLNVAAFVSLAAWVNLPAAALTLAATLIYVFVYTGWLKRRTPQNIVIGGAAGAIPPVVGWAAVTGGLELPALYLFAITFLWTPPHFWALALLMQRDYQKAGIPMLPVVSGRPYTAWNILAYALGLVALTLAFATTSVVGWVYLGAAALLGGWFISLAWRLTRSISSRNARRLYLYSLLYLALLFSAMMADSAVSF
ncbi:MAG: heme o synthase [Dehalococcoidia bacterium]|jgi:protoheme IX farnesyltransferase|nr:heme o synthase [Dehalococcoidia bacterium]